MLIMEEKISKQPFWSEEVKLKVWEKGILIKNYDASKWRMDKFGLLMNYDHYENINSSTSWKIGFTTSLKNGGLKKLNNLIPKNTRSR